MENTEEIVGIEDMKLCYQLVYELGDGSELEELRSSDAWDSFKFQIDGHTIELGKTMYDEFYPAENWERNQFGGFEGNTSYSTYEHTPDYVSFHEVFYYKLFEKTEFKRYNEYDKSEIDIQFDKRMLDFKELSMKAIPIIERYIEVFRGYIDC